MIKTKVAFLESRLFCSPSEVFGIHFKLFWLVR